MKKVKPPIYYRIWFIALLVIIGFFGVLVTALSLLLWPIAIVLAILRIVWSIRQFKQRSSFKATAAESVPNSTHEKLSPTVELPEEATIQIAIIPNTAKDEPSIPVEIKTDKADEIDGHSKHPASDMVINFSCPRLYTKDALNKMLAHYIALDIEATGLNPISDKIIELSAIVFKNGSIVDKFSTLINPECRIPSRITKMTGISNSMVMDAPSLSTALKDFTNFLDTQKGFTRFVAHNARFDLDFLRTACETSSISMNYQFEDTLRLAKKLNLETPNKKLGTLCEFYGIDLSSAHRSESDATACGYLFSKLCAELLAQNEQRKANFSAVELEYCSTIKQILCDFGINTDMLSFRRGTYLSAHMYSPFFKLKLGLKVRYALIDSDAADEINVSLQKASKSETESHYLRMPLETSYDLLEISSYIVDKCTNAEDAFRASCVFSGERVLKALESLVDEGISI